MTKDSDTGETEVGLEVGLDGLKLHVREKGPGLLSRVFGAVFSKAEGRAVIDSQMAATISGKLQNNEPLTEAEDFFFRRLYCRELKRQLNQDAIHEQAVDLLPELERKMSQLPPVDEGTTSDRWVARFENDCADASEANVRDLYARVAAGETARPGSFSLKTLGVVRELDTTGARLFERVLPYVANSMVPIHVMTSAEHESLAEIGLVHSDQKEIMAPSETLGDGSAQFYCQVSNSLVIAQSKLPPTTVTLFGFSLTRAGKELACIPSIEVRDEHRRAWASQLAFQCIGLSLIGYYWQRLLPPVTSPAVLTWAIDVDGRWQDEKSFDPEVTTTPAKEFFFEGKREQPQKRPKNRPYHPSDAVVDG